MIKYNNGEHDFYFTGIQSCDIINEPQVFRTPQNIKESHINQHRPNRHGCANEAQVSVVI